jgi:Type I phosphodiesterase / nucleotide pyrophosphatase
MIAGKRSGSALIVVGLVVVAACSYGEGSSGEEDAEDTGEFTQQSAGEFRNPPEIKEPEFSEASGDGWFARACSLPPKYVRRIRRGYFPGRGPDIALVNRLPHNFGGLVSAAHTGPFDYLQQVPLVLYGPGHIKSQGPVSLKREVSVADIGPTIAELIGTRFGTGGPGRPITQALEAAEEKTDPPRLVVVVVWDGGGWNVLNTWPEKWPFLKGLMQEGTSVENAIVGFSPSVTPPVHATIGTSAWPRDHGAVSLRIPVEGRMRNVYAGGSPQYLEAPTLADEYDQTTGNRAKIGLVAGRDWHLGMIGHGAYIDGGDRDIAAIIDTTKRKDFIVNESYYRLPRYLGDVRGLNKDARTVDSSDGRRDGEWMSHSLEGSEGLFRSPAWDLFQTRLIEAVIDRERFGRDAITDLFYTNYKQIDHLGHFYNMLSLEIGESIRFADRALKDLVSFLDSKVGHGEWVLALTADHGQSPHPTVVDGWPIDRDELARSVGRHFGVPANEFVWNTTPNGLWLNPSVMANQGIDEIEIVEFLLDYRAKDNVRKGKKVLEQFKDDLDEKIFAAAFPMDQIDRVWRCVKQRDRSGR